MALTERKVPRPRGQGQWALGYHEPLNGAEQIKKEAEPLEVRERIERIFAPGGFRSIGKQDLRNRMRWWGLYTQRKQGVAWRADRQRRTGGARGRVLHDADPHRRRPAHLRPAPRDRLGERDVRPRPRRRHGSPERAAALDPDRGRPGDLGAPRIHRAHDRRGMRGHAACDPRVPPRRHRGRRDPRRDTDDRRDPRSVRRNDGVLEPPAEVQVLDQRLRRALHRSRDQRHLVGGRRTPGARTRLRPVGRRRAVDEPDVRAAPRGLRRAGTGSRDLGRGHEPRTASTATAARATSPGSSS